MNSSDFNPHFTTSPLSAVYGIAGLPRPYDYTPDNKTRISSSVSLSNTTLRYLVQKIGWLGIFKDVYPLITNHWEKLAAIYKYIETLKYVTIK